jgi:hypothetical protein
MAFPHGNLTRLLAGFLILCGSILAADQAAKESDWKPLFDGKTLQGWKEAPFTGRGEVRVENGVIILGNGIMTGITYDGKFPVSNYEVRFEAARLDGSDFFASLTFPVGDSHLTWVVGGWGGNVVGLSSLDGMDASENETTSVWQFQRGRYYTHLLRVTDDRVSASLDGEWAVDVLLRGRTPGLRFGESEYNKPLGFAAWSTSGGIRKIEYRLLPPSEGEKEK